MPTPEVEPATALPADVVASSLYNADLAPTPPSRRTWGRWNVAALWVGMSVCTTTYMLGANLLKMGMNWWQAVLTIAAGNLVVLVPMCLNAHAGTLYGIPFPVLIRSSFGTTGSNVPALARAIVACGWFGIQTWLGGKAIYKLLLIFYPEWSKLAALDVVGINPAELACFGAFWLLNVLFIVRGTESIKWLETLAAPFLIAIGVALLWWGVQVGGSLEAVLAKSEVFTRPTASVEVEEDGSRSLRIRPLERAARARVDDGPWFDLTPGVTENVSLDAAGPSAKKAASGIRVEIADAGGKNAAVLVPAETPASGRSFWWIFFPALTAMVGYWATLSLNIPDFTRFARTQRDQVLGQLYGLPTTMAFYSFIGIAVTCASLFAFGDILAHEQAPWDPVDLLGRFTSPPIVAVSMIALLVATLTTNIAANVVSPANDFSNAAPRYLGYVRGGLLTALIGVVMMPWKLLATNEAYVYTWLIGYGALLGPIAGIMIADYFVVKRAELYVADLYRPDGRYGRWNWRTLAVLAIAVFPCLGPFLVKVGLLAQAAVPAPLLAVYDYSWFIGFGIAFVLQAILAKREKEVF